MARALRASLALSALALSAFAGVALAAPKADNVNAGPPPSPSDPCLDIVGGGGTYAIDPIATVPGPTGNVVVGDSATLTFTMYVAQPSCIKGNYTLNLFSETVNEPVNGTAVLPSEQLASVTQRGTGDANATTLSNGSVGYPVHFTVTVHDPTLIAPALTGQDPNNPCVQVQGVTSSMGKTADVAPNSGLFNNCGTTSPGTVGFN